MKKRNNIRLYVVTLLLLSVFLGYRWVSAEGPAEDKIRLEEGGAGGIEISTEELKQILAAGKTSVIDVRPREEYDIGHIPGSIHIFETEIEHMLAYCPDKSNGPVLYCNGPYCHKTLRVAEKLIKKGCLNVKKYRLGFPIWRAFGYATETTLPGFKHLYLSDKATVLVDARSREEFQAGTVPGAVNLKASELEAANQDGRLPYKDHGRRIVVFGKTTEQARELSQAIAHRAYWNCSYLAGTYEDLKKTGLW
jgi:rhodanese-related sulfurtransferase